ncbi:MAG TPA: ABC transporter substrate-binding protein [Phototrophicaceae bacterium]|nr:ABC transporter substrate-binding protein [Phototrophicaceae bacterium]
MFRKAVTTLMLSLLLAVFALAPVSGQSDTALTDMRFFLGYIPNIQFSPVYIAAAKGYFADEGYNAVLEHGDENVGVEQIAVGDIPFGAVSGETVIQARSNDRPVVFVYQWYTKYPIALVIPDTTGVTTMAELKGKKVGIPGRFGASYSGLIALLKANDMTEEDVQVETIGFNAPDVICVGAVDAAVVYINNEPLQVRTRAANGDCGAIKDVTVIPVSDYINMVSNGIVTNEDTVANHPEMVSAVNRAFDHGLRDVINNPAEAYLLSLDYIENMPASDEFKAALQEEADKQTEFLAGEPTREEIAESRATLLETLKASFTNDDLNQLEVLLATIDLWDTDTLGVTDEANWKLTQDVLLQIGAISKEIDLTAAFTNDFLPDAEGTGE